MRAFSYLYLILQVLLFNTFPPTSVEKICRQLAESNPTNVNYDFCVTSLQSDPESSSADIQQLAIIATRLSIANATSTKSKIEELLQEQDSGSYIKMRFDDCLKRYSDAIDELPVAADDVKVMEIYEAKVLLSAVVDVGDDCECGFTEGGVQSPLTMENRNLAGLSSIALGITASLGLVGVGVGVGVGVA